MHRVRRVGVIKTATTVAVLYALAIAIFAIPFALFAAAAGGVGTGGQRIGFVEVLTFAVLGILLYGVLGWIFTAIGCAIYNLAARFTGGIEIALDLSTPPSPPAVWAPAAGTTPTVSPPTAPPPGTAGDGSPTGS